MTTHKGGLEWAAPDEIAEITLHYVENLKSEMVTVLRSGGTVKQHWQGRQLPKCRPGVAYRARSAVSRPHFTPHRFAFASCLGHLHRFGAILEGRGPI